MRSKTWIDRALCGSETGLETPLPKHLGDEGEISRAARDMAVVQALLGCGHAACVQHRRTKLSRSVHSRRCRSSPEEAQRCRPSNLATKRVVAGVLLDRVPRARPEWRVWEEGNELPGAPRALDGDSRLRWKISYQSLSWRISSPSELHLTDGRHADRATARSFALVRWFGDRSRLADRSAAQRCVCRAAAQLAAIHRRCAHALIPLNLCPGVDALARGG